MAIQFRMDILKNAVEKSALSMVLAIAIIQGSYNLTHFMHEHGFIIDIGCQSAPFLKLCLAGNHVACVFLQLFMGIILLPLIPIMLGMIFGLFYFVLNYNEKKRSAQDRFPKARDRFPKELIINMIFIFFSPIISGLLGMVHPSNNTCYESSNFMFPFLECQFIGLPLIGFPYFFFHLSIFFYVYQYKKVQEKEE